MAPPKPQRRWWGLPLWIVVAFLPSLTAAFIERGTWYEALVKPAWTPPSWVFGPVWTLLYGMMGVASWKVWTRRGFGDAGTRNALLLYLVHLAFNAAWTWLFFGMHLITLAAVEIVVLWAMILALVVLFWRQDRIAGLLLLPYLIWVSYALTLNIGLAMLN